jgi:hypothetical protein
MRPTRRGIPSIASRAEHLVCPLCESGHLESLQAPEPLSGCDSCGRADEIRKEAAIVHRALRRSERSYILSAKFDKAQEMATLSLGIGNMITGITVMLEHAEVRAA